MMKAYFASALALTIAACTQTREIPIGVNPGGERCKVPDDGAPVNGFMDAYIITLYVPPPGATTCKCSGGECRTLETVCLTGTEVAASADGLALALRGVRLEELDADTSSCIHIVAVQRDMNAPATCADIERVKLLESNARICAGTSEPARGTLGLEVNSMVCAFTGGEISMGYENCVARI